MKWYEINVTFQSVKGLRRADRYMHCMAVKKSRKPSGFVIDSYLTDSSLTAVKRDAKF